MIPVVHSVPYFSQWESPELVSNLVAGTRRASQDPLWKNSGAESPDSYEFWSGRLCGVACLRMALKFWFGVAPTAFDILRECVDAGAYRLDGQKVHGLIYAPFADYVTNRWRIQADSRPQLPVSELRDLIREGALPLLSVHKSIRTPAVTPPSRGGHLVLGVGASDSAIYLHNPSGFHSVSQEFAELSWRDFDGFYAGRGVVLLPPGSSDR
ncbi:C39 family peptidase [Streptomyces sp. SID8376]|uniref:C39 family peptidase n=1 Tax=unclassified Streptomyces TaxID=2593676 RepID=UPI0005677F1A